MNVADLIIDKFHPVMTDVLDEAHPHTDYWMQGGRASTKSSFISVVVILLVITFPFANAVVLRRYGSTLRDSVFAQCKWAVNELGLSQYFKFYGSPQQMVYLPTGQRVLFTGLDDPLKLKGTNFENGYAAVAWFEELDQFENWDKISSVLRSLRRGGDRFWTFYSYNPPKAAWSWVNRMALEMKARPTCLVSHSTYLDVVDAGKGSWLGSQFVEDAEWMKQAHPAQYEWELLGKVIGSGGSVFENLVDREITDEEIMSFDNPHHGVDFGWFPDPWRFVQCEWQAGQRRILIYGEHSENRKTPRDTGQIIKQALTYPDREGQKARYHNHIVWCDGADPTSIGVYRRECGLNARPARKGNMRKTSYLWLAGLREIVIDPVRCPRTFEEFALCEYAKDKNDEWMEDFNDGNDHSIDAVRYAFMEEAIRGR